MEYLKAFVIGGALCAIGQIFIDKTKLTPARILVGFVVAGVALSALGFYEPFVDFAGAGATVPLSGFGHLLAKGVRAAVNDYGILGAFTGGISAAAGGITAAIVFAFAAALLFKPKDK
ncbi:MAG: stage V sporulation protein AE [Oscillospiraceae bacterium]|nr:stage V sporulation protein AE [Oscillospiraceae bacterium]MBQ6699694.1 stage V sporulation protein AE [Oscillospiraceae bacterium]